MNKRKLLIVVNVDWFLISHRLPIAEKAIEEGWEVHVASYDSGRADEIVEKGMFFYDIPFSRSGTNIMGELKCLRSLYSVYKEVKPQVIHQVTLKPVIYGSLVSRFVKVPGIVNAISGLGYNFTAERRSKIQSLMLRMMRFGFKKRNLAVIFQNKDDLNEIQNLNVLNTYNKAFLIKGSGVDLNKFKEQKFVEKDKVRVLFPARMLEDKGINEFIKAAEILKPKFKKKAVFVLAGMVDEENKAGVSKEYLLSKLDKGYLEWIGFQKDMIKTYTDSDIVVLPSYREGMPKSLIEACAIGRPIVTTNAVGCKECVDEGVNGFKVPVKSINRLAQTIEKLILSSELRKEMGRNARLKAEKEFSLSSVIDKHLEIYTELYEAKK